MVDTNQLKKETESIILSQGGKICDWLPALDYKGIKSAEQIIKRVSVMNALCNIAFEAPTEIIYDWIKKYNLEEALSEHEKKILSKKTKEVTEQEKVDLGWYVEGIWALLWVGEMINALPINRPVEDCMASILPNIETGEDNSKLESHMKIRSESEIYKIADLYYRIHWMVVDAREKGARLNLDEGIIMERRKALFWIIDPDINWDEVDMNT